MFTQQRKHWDTMKENYMAQREGKIREVQKEKQKHKVKTKVPQEGLERNPWKRRIE